MVLSRAYNHRPLAISIADLQIFVDLSGLHYSTVYSTHKLQYKYNHWVNSTPINQVGSYRIGSVHPSSLLQRLIRYEKEKLVQKCFSVRSNTCLYTHEINYTLHDLGRIYELSVSNN